MLKIHFFIRNSQKASPDEKVAIYAILELPGHERDVPFSTSLSVPKKYWKGESVDQSYVWAEEINQSLQQIQLKLKTTMQLLREEGEEVNYKNIRRVFSTKDKKLKLTKSKTFLEVYDLMVDEKKAKKDLSEGTVRNYRTVRKNLVLFFSKIKRDNPRIEELDMNIVDDFLRLFRGGFCEDHVNKHCWAIKRTFDYAVRRRLMKPIPLWDLDLKASDPQAPHYLTAAMRAAVESVNVPSLQDTKRIATFLWSTGFSYTDYLSLDGSNLVATAQGMCWKKQRGKTKNFSFPPLLPGAAQVLDHYGGVAGLPRPHINDLNARLRILGEIAGITDEAIGWHLTSSACRDTFSSMMENEFMVDSRVVMAMMGWTNPRQMRAYSSVQPERILFEIHSKFQGQHLLKLSS